MSEKNDVLVQVEHLKKYFPVKGLKGPGVQAVEDISIFINRGETLGLVESRMWKTTSGPYDFSCTSRLPEKLFTMVKQFLRDRIHGREDEEWTVTSCKSPEVKQANMLPYRRKMQIIFQDPSASLDPRMTVGEIIGEALDIHKLFPNKQDRTDRIKELLGRVGLNTEHANRYPHEFSGGQQQRVGIARALAVNPEFIVCDEPISALDVSIQSQVVNMLEDMQEEMGLTYLFIAHDLSVVRHISHRIGVMYLGTMVELAESYELNRHPLHPYTQDAALRSSGSGSAGKQKQTANRARGDIPSPMNPPSGCRFHTRCPYAMDKCKECVPKFKEYEKATGWPAICQ